ncbi:hypothetical protein [Clostridium intestinale]|uniref:Uncharacterized protein n=2 Tax=Clostridium intestinale TaxID=36845 RepID=U2PZ93_9CLOT|nr:hypothetical protein [Clostridium intestinale]ERK31840.1 hypothetical protein CINTURNW_0812 [Clostridium intestinale URNW]QLY78813.1 hypothetical protein HZF06_17235 [Clostridium intestinale]
MSKKRDKPSGSKDTKKSKNNNPPDVNKDNFSNKSNKNSQSSNDSIDFNSPQYRHDMGELVLLNDQLYAVYTGLASYLFLLKATQESIDQIVIKYQGGDVTKLPNPAVDANLSTIFIFFTLLQFTKIGYSRFVQVSREYEEGTTDVHPRFRQEILYGQIISVANIIDQRIRELNSPYSPILTPFPG